MTELEQARQEGRLEERAFILERIDMALREVHGGGNGHKLLLMLRGFINSRN
jgi:hypothetical protein